MLEALLSSRVRAKLLTALFMTPWVEHNAWELTKTLDEEYSVVSKELVRLEGMGILISEPSNNSRNYYVDTDCPIASDLRSMILKTEEIGELIRSNLAEMQAISHVFIYGAYASGEAGEKSSLDLMVIGDVELAQLSPTLTQVEKALKHAVKATVLTEDDWEARIKSQDALTLKILRSPKVMLIGGEEGV